MPTRSFERSRTKFPKQLGKREPIVRRTDLGPERIYYRTMVGPFASMEDATRKAGVPEGDRLRRPTPRGLESRKNPCFFCPPALRTDFGSFRLAVATGVLLNSSSDLQDTTLILNILIINQFAANDSPNGCSSDEPTTRSLRGFSS